MTTDTEPVHLIRPDVIALTCFTETISFIEWNDFEGMDHRSKDGEEDDEEK